MDADGLYGLPLERFVAERGALARALRAGGRRDQAAQVAALRKPSVAAWAVNQLVRTQRGAVDELFAAGDRLQAAQQRVLSGRGDGHDLRTAAEHERRAVEVLVSAARGLLTADGHELSATIIERVSDTLHAAALDDDARALVRDGRLERELRHVGLGNAIVPRTRSVRGRRAVSRPAKTGTTGALESRTATPRLDDDRAQARKVARAAEADARRRAERAARAVEVAEARRERTAQALQEAEEALTAAQKQAEAAVDAHRRARQELSGL